MDLDILGAIARFFARGHIQAINEYVDEIEKETNADRRVIRKHIEIAEHLDAIGRLNPEKTDK